MDLEFTDELRDFQLEARAFIAEKLPAELAHKSSAVSTSDRDDYIRWQDILAEQGWLAYNWPDGIRRCRLVTRPVLYLPGGDGAS